LVGGGKDTHGYFPGFCKINLQPYREYGLGLANSYSNDPTWVLGATFMNAICFSFDYAKNTLGVGSPWG
jgi:hypothetical protein